MNVHVLSHFDSSSDWCVSANDRVQCTSISEVSVQLGNKLDLCHHVFGTELVFRVIAVQFFVNIRKLKTQNHY